MKAMAVAVLIAGVALATRGEAQTPAPPPEGALFWSTNCRGAPSADPKDPSLKTAAANGALPSAAAAADEAAKTARAKAVAARDDIAKAGADTVAKDAATQAADAAEKVATEAEAAAKAADDAAARISAAEQNARLHPAWDGLCARQVIDTFQPIIEHVEIATRNAFVGSSGLFDVLAFRDLGTPDGKGANSSTSSLVYRAALTDLKTGEVVQFIDQDGIWSESATAGSPRGSGTDFRANESASPKTLLHMDFAGGCAGDWSCWALWKDRRLTIIGFDPATGKPVVYGSKETTVTRKGLAATLAVLLSVLAYVLAAAAVAGARARLRMHDDEGKPITSIDGKPPAPASLASFFDALRPRRSQGGQKTKHGHLVGTNYQGFWQNLNPVILSAGPNGLGNATNLQILFFSLIVFGVVTYIWMMAGILTALSPSVVLLMGISGVGGTAAAGTDLKTNRLSFDSWAWLIEREWLPPGGIAEVNVAQWKDIFTTGGAFDVYRFQMVCFSVVVGLSLISVGAQAVDLSSFTIPDALLGILGLSQTVYVAGKLVAAPNIAELDAQIVRLKKAEGDLQDLNAAAIAGGANVTRISWTPDADLVAAQKALVDYDALWTQTKIMFEATIGRFLPPDVVKEHPPFAMANVVRNRLPLAPLDPQKGYGPTLLSLINAPDADYQWTWESGDARDMKFDPAHGMSVNLTIPATSLTKPRLYTFAIRISDPTSNRSIVRQFQLKVPDPAATDDNA